MADRWVWGNSQFTHHNLTFLRSSFYILKSPWGPFWYLSIPGSKPPEWNCYPLQHHWRYTLDTAIQDLHGDLSGSIISCSSYCGCTMVWNVSMRRNGHFVPLEILGGQVGHMSRHFSDDWHLKLSFHGPWHVPMVTGMAAASCLIVWFSYTYNSASSWVAIHLRPAALFSLHHILWRGCKAIGPGVLVGISIKLLVLVTSLATLHNGFSNRE